MSPPAQVVAAWQAALAAEHAAIFGYGTLGPHLPAVRIAQAQVFQRAHRLLRDAVVASMAGQGVTAVGPKAGYLVPIPLTTGPRADRYAQRLEEACAAAWRYLVAVAAGQRTAQTALRATAVAALSDSAVRAMHWRALLDPAAPTVAFPGI